MKSGDEIDTCARAPIDTMLPHYLNIQRSLFLNKLLACMAAVEAKSGIFKARSITAASKLKIDKNYYYFLKFFIQVMCIFKIMQKSPSCLSFDSRAIGTVSDSSHTRRNPETISADIRELTMNDVVPVDRKLRVSQHNLSIDHVLLDVATDWSNSTS